jgi:hypothetical protein
LAAASIAGAIASLSHALMINTSTPCAISASMSVNCFADDDSASAETYSFPSALIAATIAASSVFQRYSWKLAQETPIFLSLAIAPPIRAADRAALASNIVANFFI